MLFPKKKTCKKHRKQRLNCQNLRSLHRTTQKLTQYACLKVKSRFVKEKEVLAKCLLQKVWLVAIATILSKTFTNHSLFMSAVVHNLSFFAIFKKNWSLLEYKTPLNVTGDVIKMPGFSLCVLCGPYEMSLKWFGTLRTTRSPPQPTPFDCPL